MFTNTTNKLLHLQELNRQINTKYNGRMTKQGAEIERLVAKNLQAEKVKQYEFIGEREQKILSLELRASAYEADENPYYFINRMESKAGYTRYIRGNQQTGEIFEMLEQEKPRAKKEYEDIPLYSGKKVSNADFQEYKKLVKVGEQEKALELLKKRGRQ